MVEPSNSNPKKAVDPQTGQEFEISPEQWFDVASAWISGLYLLAALAFFAWQLFDIWIGQHSLAARYPDTSSLNSPLFRLVAYTAIGGGLGGAVNGLRSFIGWHAEKRAFGWRFVWKYLALPPLGATLAVIVYALIRGGVAIYSGSFAGDSTTVPSLSALATGALAGYGSHQVFIWLDEQVNKLFSVTKKALSAKAVVPDLIGKTQDEAVKILEDAQLKHTVESAPQDDAAKIGKVVSQKPDAGADIPDDKTVIITVGIAKTGGG